MDRRRGRHPGNLHRAHADGSVVEPTGKSYKMNMATIGHWTEDGVMDEEYLFWDNANFYAQIGLGE